MSVQERPRDRDHLLLAAGERASTLVPALPELGEELVHEVIASVAAAHGQPKVLFDGQAGEHVPILRDVSDASPHDRVRGQPGCVLPSISTVPRERGTSPMSARSVVVLPTPFRPRSAVTPPFSTANETPCSTCDSPR